MEDGRISLGKMLDRATVVVELIELDLRELVGARQAFVHGIQLKEIFREIKTTLITASKPDASVVTYTYHGRYMPRLRRFSQIIPGTVLLYSRSFSWALLKR